MRRWTKEAASRRVRAGGAVGIAVALALGWAGSWERSADAGPNGLPPDGRAPAAPAAPTADAASAAPKDAGAASSLVAHAQRGEVAPPGLDDVEQMCALLTSCDRLPLPPSLIPADFAQCVKKMTDEMTSSAAINFSLTMRECGLHSTSCAALRSCTLRGAGPEACSGRGKQNLVGSCDVDGRALTCWHEQILSVRDCPRGGEQCIVVDGQASCTLGPCPVSIKEGDKPRCSGAGTHLLRCEKGKLASLDCAAFGLKCSTAADGTATCATAGPACSGDGKRCDGEVAVGCYNGHEVRVDCAAAGLMCHAAPGATPIGTCFAAASATSACNPGDRARCDEASIKYCAGGVPRSFSCRGAGFARCEAGKGGVRCAQ